MQYETMFGHKDQQSQLGKGDESATFAGQCQHRGTFGDVVQVGLKQTVLNGQAGCIISDRCLILGMEPVYELAAV